MLTLNVTNTSTNTSFTEMFATATERDERIGWLNARGHYAWDTAEPDLYEGKPWGEQQEQVDWLESRYDDQYEGENDYYGSWDE